MTERSKSYKKLEQTMFLTFLLKKNIKNKDPQNSLLIKI